jgi:hypothetical protein
MKKPPISLGAVLLAVVVSACAGFEHSETLISPTAPSLPTVPGGSGGLTGTWTSPAAAIPNSWSCGSFQWSINSQTPSSLAGEFYAICAAVVLVHGSASGQLNGAGSEAALRVSGTATVQGMITCPFDINGTGYIQGNEAIRIVYSGSTCLGPVQGEETLRRPADPSAPPPTPPAPPAPEPPPPPPGPSPNPYHVAPGPLTAAQAERVVFATAREFPNLTAAPSSESEGTARCEQLLLRTIWHLRLAGFDAGRQRNPSGAISNDKLTILIEGTWRAFDIFQDLGHPGVPVNVIFLEVFPAGPLSYPGIPD